MALSQPVGTTQRVSVGRIFLAAMILLAGFVIIPGASAQVSDVKVEKPKKDTTARKSEAKPPHSIARAAIYSAVLPGLGQAYNRKAWKIPIIYAGFGVIGYFVYSNTKEFRLYKEAYIYTANGETYETDNPLVGRYNATQLEDGMEFYKRNRDLSIIVGALWYTANILEAYADAHFFDYDVSDDLTLKVGPSAVSMPMLRPEPVPGIKVTFKF
jgi:hypothetical protein